MAPGILIPDTLREGLGTSISPAQAPSVSTVFHHSLITDSIDPLRFDAAASLQLISKNGHKDAKLGHELVISPYNESPNLLDLDALDIQEQLLAKAFTLFKPISDDYASADYRDAFNWEHVLGALKDIAVQEDHRWESQAFYIVYFRSQLQENARRDSLAETDNRAHAEAMASGGLLKYWFGKAGSDGKNLATCIWQSKDHAIEGGRGPWHQEARRLVSEYKWIHFQRGWLWIDTDVADWQIIYTEDVEKAEGAPQEAIVRARGVDP